MNDRNPFCFAVLNRLEYANFAIYDDIAQLGDMLRYIRDRYPDMRIVTIDQGLDLLGIPEYHPEQQTGRTGKTTCTEPTCS